MAPADTIGIGQESMNNLIILDRDGVINEDSDAYIKTLDEWIPLPGSIDAIARLSRAGYTVVVATNQSGIARGYFTVATLDAMHKRLTDLVRDAGGEMGKIFYCPHGPDEILLSGNIGYLADTESVESLARNIILAFSERGDTSPLVKRANRYTVSNAAKHYREILTFSGTNG